MGGFVIGQRLLWDTQRPLPLCFPFQLVAAVVFLSFGVAAAFCCATVDGVFAARHIVSPIFLFCSLSLSRV